VKPRKRKRKGSEAEEKPGGVHGSMPIWPSKMWILPSKPEKYPLVN
jgi:hypothetical protein